MSVILFYAPFNQRSRDNESLMIAFRNQGHKVMCLSQHEGYQINDFLNANGVQASSYVIPGKRTGWWYYFRHILYFITFCWKNDIQIIYSHLEPANFVTSIGQYFIKGKTYLCRHHIDEGMLYKFDKDLYYRFTYKLARKIIVVSSHAKKYMIEKENIPSYKIIHIDLGYDFSLYSRPDKAQVTNIQNLFKADIFLLAACRLTAFKRPDLILKTARRLRTLGLDVKVVLLGKGEMQEQLEFLIDELELQQTVFMPGYVDNVLEFMAAADFFLHPSLLDSSCVAIKEAGLVSLPVIACNGVGDFEDYLVPGKNGFLVEPDKFVEEASNIIVQNYRDKNLLNNIGENLRKSVLERFSIEKVIQQYNSLNQ
ncbi:MAG TPA: glycosyltransferase family 4 protein [Cyclobacteriaceae bacterium]|jgi:glycosyltransferase involved in cell wall biosynthesis|nr:glycosyltransferase family 4 protein [Cyclobacteriaceae bacterium]